MPHDNGRQTARQGVRAAGNEKGTMVVLVEVGPADATVPDLNQNLARPGGWLGNLLQPNVLPSVPPGGKHRSWPPAHQCGPLP